MKRTARSIRVKLETANVPIFRSQSPLKLLNNSSGWHLLALKFNAVMIAFALCGEAPLAAQYTATESTLRKPIVVQDCRISALNAASLASERNGILERVVAPGELVKQGEVIAQIRDASARAALRVAEKEAASDVDLRYARIASELAQLKYERAAAAERKVAGTVTELELMEYRLDAERSLLQMEQAEQFHAVAVLKKDQRSTELASYQIVAPFDGFVRAVHQRPSEYVREGDPVIELINDQLMLAEGFVDFALAESLALGDRVDLQSKIAGAAGQARFYGQLNFIDRKVEPISMQVRISAQIQNNNSILKDGILATMSISPR